MSDKRQDRAEGKCLFTSKGPTVDPWCVFHKRSAIVCAYQKDDRISKLKSEMDEILNVIRSACFGEENRDSWVWRAMKSAEFLCGFMEEQKRFVDYCIAKSDSLEAENNRLKESVELSIRMLDVYVKDLPEWVHSTVRAVQGTLKKALQSEDDNE